MTMRRLGLALSGGGFRATIFHLGLVRFLRDAGILPDVTHITSVSGGSIIAAHLALNWDRYCGSPEQFEAVAKELLDYLRLDVRNRIVRRYPFTIPVRMGRRLLRRDVDRWMTRTGLLESYYRRHLYGDTSLFELPERPQLHLLATNLSEGGLCSFTQRGLIFQHRTSPTSFRFDRVQVDLATVAMGVAASSAFPGFFPPLQLTSSDVGASEGDFGRQSFTDGGIFDNLGIRMFRFIERSWIGREARLQRHDFVDLEAALKAVNAALVSSEELPGARFSRLLSAAAHDAHRFDSADELLECLSNVMVDSQLYRDSNLDGLQIAMTDAQSLLDSARCSDEPLSRDDHLWLNRQILGAAFQLMTGKPCLRPFGAGLDGVLVSDAGKPFQTVTESHPGSLIATSMRSTDILMDRVGQLERETFGDAPGFVFASTSHEVLPEEDENAIPVAVQRRIPTIRTDMDRFSTDEISSLLRHGYCVGRQMCRENADLFGEDLPAGPPWDPLVPDKPAVPVLTAKRERRKAASEPTRQARQLHKSSQRRIWSTMWDYRDWVSYIYIPILVPLLLFGPYVGYRVYRQSQLISSVSGALQHAGPFLIKAFDLLESGPVERWESMPFDDVAQLEPESLGGVDVLHDQRIIDLRARDSRYEYHRLNVRRSEETDAEGPPVLRLREQTAIDDLRVRSPSSALRPRISKVVSVPGDSTEGFTWQIAFDLSHVPLGELADVIVETQQPQSESSLDLQPVINAGITGNPGVLTLIVLLPENRPFNDYWVLRTDRNEPGLVKRVVPNSAAGGGNDTVIMIQIARPEPDSIYECHWTWKDNAAD